MVMVRASSLIPTAKNRISHYTRSLTCVDDSDIARSGVTSAVIPMSYPRLQEFNEAQRIVSFSCVLRALRDVCSDNGDGNGDARDTAANPLSDLLLPLRRDISRRRSYQNQISGVQLS